MGIRRRGGAGASAEPTLGLAWAAMVGKVGIVGMVVGMVAWWAWWWALPACKSPSRRLHAALWQDTLHPIMLYYKAAVLYRSTHWTYNMLIRARLTDESPTTFLVDVEGHFSYYTDLAGLTVI